MKLVEKGRMQVNSISLPAWPHKWNFSKINNVDITADKCLKCGVTVKTYFFAETKIRKQFDEACINKSDKDAEYRLKNRNSRELKKNQLKFDL